MAHFGEESLQNMPENTRRAVDFFPGILENSQQFYSKILRVNPQENIPNWENNGPYEILAQNQHFK